MNKHTVCILIAGILWGFMGIFARELHSLGFDSASLLVARGVVAVTAFGLTLLIKDRKLFRIRLRHLWCFLGAGLCSLLFFTFCYFQCIYMTSMSTAAVLLYTSPSFVMIISLFLFREQLTLSKLLALVMSFGSCILVSGLNGGQSISTTGLLYGLGAGSGYALYSIFARLAMNRGYDSKTVNFYAITISFIGACAVWGVVAPLKLAVSSWQNMAWLISTGIISCYLPYLLYTYGMTGVDTGKASIMSSTEPIVATLLGVIVYSDQMSIYSVLGVFIMVGAIFVLNVKGRLCQPILFKVSKTQVEENM